MTGVRTLRCRHQSLVAFAILVCGVASFVASLVVTRAIRVDKERLDEERRCEMGNP